jgi:hypothetical protein
MYGSTACSASETYTQLAEQYRARMWATPIFTEARVAHEKKANEYQSMADSAARACSREGSASTSVSTKKSKKSKKSFEASTQADIDAAAAAATSAAGPGISGTQIALAIGGIVLLGGAAALLTRKKS